MLGDFNICLLKDTSNLRRDYENLLKLFNFKQLIKSPTHVTLKSSSLIDHISVNCPEKISQSGVIESGISDHFITFCTRKIVKGQIGRHTQVKIRSLKNYCTNSFVESLKEVDWSVVLSCEDVNEASDKFKTIFTQKVDDAAKEKLIRIKGNTDPWITSEILDLMHERDEMKIKSIKHKSNTELWKRYKTLRNQTTKAKNEAKENYFSDKIEENKNNPTALWRQFKSLGISNKIIENAKIVLNIDEEKCHEAKRIVNFFCRSFTNIASKDSTSFQRFNKNIIRNPRHLNYSTRTKILPKEF